VRSELTSLDGGKVKLSVEVDEATFDEAVAEAFRRIAREVRIPGFRPGKVPRRVLEARIGGDYARAEALQSAIPGYYADAVREHEVDVIAPPDIDLTSGEEDGPVAFDAVVQVRPEVDITGYSDITVEIPSPLASDSEIDERIDAMRAQHADLVDVDRPAIDGDNVSIDITSSIDGEPVPGLTADDYLYEVGIGAVVPELDAELRGAKAGAILAFEAPHPSDPDQVLDFRILVKQVKAKVLPALTDEWVAESTEFESVQELRDDVSRRMNAVRRFQAQLALRDKAAEALGELVDDDSIPEAMVDNAAADRLHQFAHQLQERGISLEDWSKMPGNDPEQLQEDVRGAARTGAKIDLALRAVARLEGFEVTSDDLEEELARAAEQYEQDVAELRGAIESGDGLMAVRSDLLKRKALDWLLDAVAVVDPDGAPIDRSLLEPEVGEPEHGEPDTASSAAEGEPVEGEPADDPDAGAGGEAGAGDDTAAESEQDTEDEDRTNEPDSAAPTGAAVGDEPEEEGTG